MNYLYLTKTTLFHGLNEEEIKKVALCLNAYEKTFKKNEVIFHVGSIIHEFGIIETGSVNIVVNSYWGDSNILGHVEKGEIFAQNFASITGKELHCDVVAAETTKVIFLDITSLITTCQISCSFHHRLIQNMFRISSLKNLDLSNKIMHTAPKSIRKRLLSYLSEQAMVHGSSQFTIPFDRQQLADYLMVDRSAMSNELSKMQKEGLLTFHKNKFTLNNSYTNQSL